MAKKATKVEEPKEAKIIATKKWTIEKLHNLYLLSNERSNRARKIYSNYIDDIIKFFMVIFLQYLFQPNHLIYLEGLYLQLKLFSRL